MERRHLNPFEELDDTFSPFTATTPPNDSNSPQIPTTKIFDRYSYALSSSSDDDESHPSNPSIEVTNKRLDYMIQFLDRKLTNPNNFHNHGSSNGYSPNVNKTSHPGSLPEFVAKGGGTGIFELPPRAAVHPNRPPSVDVRPHPLRDTQIGRFLRTVTSTKGQLWAGTEDGGVRVWELNDLYGCGMEEEGTAPYRESVKAGVGSSVMCMVGDEGRGVVWSGHRDGRLKCWKMKMEHRQLGFERFTEVLSWQAHRGPVLCTAISSYGDLWSGSEGGGIKVWPREAIDKSFSLIMKERHRAALLLERSYIDLRSQVLVNGFSNISNSEIRCLLSDNVRANMWSAGYFSFALWDAHTRELLKVFNIDGQVENRVEFPLVPDFAVQGEVNMVVTGSKKEKTQTSFGFFQRSRNAIMGAADLVRRVATKGGFGDDPRRTEAMILTIDGMIWNGCANGLLIQWDGSGNRLQEIHLQSSAILCLCTLGTRIWIGYANGIVQILDLEGNLLKEWVAHSSPVMKMAIGNGYVFTLANHGGVRGWNITSPGHVDNILRTELAGKEFVYTRIENLKILTGTWNVAEGQASPNSLISWLGSAASEVDIVVVGLQEVEMGAGFLAVSAAKETVGLEGSSVGQWWLDMIRKTLDKGSSFELVGSRQLAGLLVAAWVKTSRKSYVGDVDAAAVPCGFGRAIGNKGAVGLRIRVFDRIICFVSCHFAAHLEAVGRRNSDFDHVYRTMTFCRPSNNFIPAAVGVSSAVQVLRGTNALGTHSAEGMPELSEADMLIFLGDFNYRLDGISYDEARDSISQRSFDWLRERDQLRAEMEAGNVFQGMREADIRFPPTYKFEKHQPGLAGYDSGEKKRIPAWCDRILYRDNRRALGSECSLECPVVASISQYEACMDVTDSDHKPVRGVFNVEIARVDESVRRQEYGDIMRSNQTIRYMLEELCKIPEVVISTSNIILQNQDKSLLRITNKCEKQNAFFEIVCEGISTNGEASHHCPSDSFGFPRWLEVTPGTGIIKPDQIAEVSIHHRNYPTQEEFFDAVSQNGSHQGAGEKEVILVINVYGSYSSKTKDHRIRVSHCISANSSREEYKPNNFLQTQDNVIHRSDYQRLGNSYDVVEHLRSLNIP